MNKKLLTLTLIYLLIIPSLAQASLSLEEKIALEADYILACQFISAGHPANGAINDVYTPDTPPDYVVPRENGMAILGLLKAYETLGDNLYLERANLSMDYLVNVQESDGSWRDEYDYRTPPGLLSKSPTQPAEVMMAMYILGYRDDRYQSMKRAAEFLFECQAHGYQGLIAGGKDAEGNFHTWNWITDNSYGYWALIAARGWALVKGDIAFAQTCQQAAAQVLAGINTYFYKTPDWWTVVDGSGNSFYFDGQTGYISWMNFAPQFLDLPANGVGNPAVGDWIRDHLRQANGGCVWGDRFPTQEYPGISFQSAFCWFDLGQNTYAQDAITWAENSGLWQLLPDQHGIAGGWVDWVLVSDPSQHAAEWERYIDTSFYSIAAWLGGYDFTVFDNDPPVLAPIGNKYGYVNEQISFQISATDPENDTLRYRAIGLPGGAAFNENTRTFSWVPTSTQTVIVRFEVSDGFLIDSEDVTINVTRRTCFVKGTPVLMADGLFKPIEEVKIGDRVLSFEEKTLSFKKGRVTKLFEHSADSYLIVNGNIKVTENHLLYSDGKWIEIGKLKVGGMLLNSKGKPEVIVSIRKVEDKAAVYNLEVSNLHTYIAAGVVVHNRKVILPAEAYSGQDGP